MLLRDARARGCGGDGAMKRGASGSGATGHRQTSELPQALNMNSLSLNAELYASGSVFCVAIVVYSSSLSLSAVAPVGTCA